MRSLDVSPRPIQLVLVHTPRHPRRGGGRTIAGRNLLFGSCFPRCGGEGFGARTGVGRLSTEQAGRRQGRLHHAGHGRGRSQRQDKGWASRGGPMPSLVAVSQVKPPWVLPSPDLPWSQASQWVTQLPPPPDMHANRGCMWVYILCNLCPVALPPPQKSEFTDLSRQLKHTLPFSVFFGISSDLGHFLPEISFKRCKIRGVFVRPISPDLA